jgi:hypothetical protein
MLPALLSLINFHHPLLPLKLIGSSTKAIFFRPPAQCDLCLIVGSHPVVFFGFYL